MANIGKFTYLRLFLSDSALQSINGLSSNVTNYKEAIEILHERYGNKQVLISAHMQTLRIKSGIKSHNDINGLKKCMLRCWSLCEEFKSFKHWYCHLWNHISAIFKWKANLRNQSDFNWKLSKRYLATGWFAKSFKKRGWGKEKIFLNWTSSEFEPEKYGRNYTTSAFLNSSLEKNCPVCNLSNHTTSKCLKVTNMAAKKQVLRQKGQYLIFFLSLHKIP